MRPGKPETPNGDLFRASLEAILDPAHELTRLAALIDAPSGGGRDRPAQPVRRQSGPGRGSAICDSSSPCRPVIAI